MEPVLPSSNSEERITDCLLALKWVLAYRRSRELSESHGHSSAPYPSRDTVCREDEIDTGDDTWLHESPGFDARLVNWGGNIAHAAIGRVTTHSLSPRASWMPVIEWSTLSRGLYLLPICWLFPDTVLRPVNPRVLLEDLSPYSPTLPYIRVGQVR